MGDKDKSNKLKPKNGISVDDKKKNSIWEGWLTKQGGSHKNWKRRYFLLVSPAGKNDEAELYYFKSDKDKNATGVIKITAKSAVSESLVKGKKDPCVAVATGNSNARTFFMHASSTDDNKKFMKAISDKINAMKSGSKPNDQRAVSINDKPASNNNSAAATQPAGGKEVEVPEDDDDDLEGIRAQLDTAKNAIPFLAGEGTEQDRILEFWQIWSESIPAQKDTEVYAMIVATADMSQLSWRVFGPQHALIQEMVDFFWNVGAPESEIDRLNSIGSIINPLTIGSWIDMSTKGGMDGGWVFPVEVPFGDALQACDEGNPLNRLKEWVSNNNITQSITVGRDMGASPPRQTEVRFHIPGSTFDAQWKIAMSAYLDFDFPVPPDNFVQIVKQWSPSANLRMSVITSSEGFVRIGLLLPAPDKNIVSKLCDASGHSPEALFQFQQKMNIQRPENVEFQHLMATFGYGVYNEGFNVVFHYQLQCQ